MFVCQAISATAEGLPGDLDVGGARGSEEAFHDRHRVHVLASHEEILGACRGTEPREVRRASPWPRPRHGQVRVKGPILPGEMPALEGRVHSARQRHETIRPLVDPHPQDSGRPERGKSPEAREGQGKGARPFCRFPCRLHDHVHAPPADLAEEPQREVEVLGTHPPEAVRLALHHSPHTGGGLPHGGVPHPFLTGVLPSSAGGGAAPCRGRPGTRGTGSPPGPARSRTAIPAPRSPRGGPGRCTRAPRVSPGLLPTARRSPWWRGRGSSRPRTGPRPPGPGPPRGSRPRGGPGGPGRGRPSAPWPRCCRRPPRPRGRRRPPGCAPGGGR